MIKSISTAHAQRGLSLIELMIAIALGIFITAGMISLFTNSSQSYRIQENASRLQENGQFAINFLTQDIRMADYWGCLTSSALITANHAAGIDATIDNYLNGAVTVTNNNGVNNSDSITLVRAEPSDIYIDALAGTKAAPLNVTDNTGLTVNDVAFVSDCSEGEIFQITALNTNDTVSHGGLDKIYGTDAQVYRVTYSTYTIDNGRNGEPALFRSIDGGAQQELIEGVESMELRYGVDENGDDTADYYVPVIAAPATMNQVTSIRIALVLRSLENNLTTQPMPFTVFGTETTPGAGDRRIRRVFNTTIAVRNRLP